jgi:hypothetical protein
MDLCGCKFMAVKFEFLDGAIAGFIISAQFSRTHRSLISPYFTAIMVQLRPVICIFLYLNKLTRASLLAQTIHTLLFIIHPYATTTDSNNNKHSDIYMNIARIKGTTRVLLLLMMESAWQIVRLSSG